jgi:hypothetical protein
LKLRRLSVPKEPAPCVDQELYDVREVLQRWLEPFFGFFKVLTTNGHTDDDRLVSNWRRTTSRPTTSGF